MRNKRGLDAFFELESKEGGFGWEQHEEKNQERVRALQKNLDRVDVLVAQEQPKKDEPTLKPHNTRGQLLEGNWKI